MKIKLSPFAEKDLDESFDYYKEQQEGLNDQFIGEVNNSFDRIKTNPNQFPKVYKDLRKAVTDNFPFNVFFVVKDTIVYVLGIFHTSRNPRIMKWRYKSVKD